MKKIIDVLYRLYHFSLHLLISLRLTVVILLSIAVSSIIGSLIPQNRPQKEMLQQFGDRLYHIFENLGFFDLYHTLWFQMLFLLLTLNIVICSIHRLSVSFKTLFLTQRDISFSRFLKRDDRITLYSEQPFKETLSACQSIIKGLFSVVQVEKNGPDTVIYAERGRWTRLGVYGVHFSVVLLITGGVVGSISGFEGRVNMVEGALVNKIRLNRSENTLVLDFEIRCDGFSVLYYKDGHLRSEGFDLALIEKGRVVRKERILVNHPLCYKGVRIFQTDIVRGEQGISITLSVTKNPGIPFIYAGFFLIIISLIITFYLSHQQVCLFFKGEKQYISITLSGISNKNYPGMERKVIQLKRRIDQWLSS